MNPLGEQVLLVAKEYLGPAAQQFLSKELRGLECTADTITSWHLTALSERARTHQRGDQLLAEHARGPGDEDSH